MAIKDVKVTISLAKAVQNTGFGFPLIHEGKATTAKAYTECGSLEEVKTALGASAETSNIYKAAQLLFMQDNAPSKVAICASIEKTTTALATILNKGWRQLIEVGAGNSSNDTIKQISDYIETTEDKLYFVSGEKAADVSTITGNDRTILVVHDDSNNAIVFPEAALVGATAGKPAGSITYKNQKLNGINAKVYSTAELNEIHNVKAIGYVLKAGDAVTSEGKNSNGEYIDVIDSMDYVIQNIEYGIQKKLNAADKLPYDNRGIAQLENIVVNVLKDAANNGIIALDDSGVPLYSVDFKPRSEVSDANRGARKYVDGSFRFSLAGAIHTVEIIGTIDE